MTTIRDEIQAARHDAAAAISTIQADLIRAGVSVDARSVPDRASALIEPPVQRDPLEKRRAESAAQPSVRGIRRADVTELGTITRGGKARTFVLYQGAEYEAGAPISNLAMTTASLVIGDRVNGINVFVPLRVVDVGTYHRLSGAADPERVDRPRERVDMALALFRSLTRTANLRAMTPATYSPSALLEAIRTKLDLELVGGRLEARGVATHIDAIRPLARLLIAELGGPACLCDHGDGQPAWTVASLDVALCQSHVEGAS